MGKGRLFSDSATDEVYNTQTQNETFVLSSQQNAQGLGGGVFNDSSGYGNFQQSGRDQRNADLNGALFRGNLGFNLDTAVLDVATNTINILQDSSDNPLARVSIDKIVFVAGGVGDLITILGAQRPGQRLRLYNIDTQVITIKNTGSAIDDTIFTPGAVDFILSGNEVVDLTYDITTTKWRIVGGAGGGTPGTSFPILYPKLDLTPAISSNQTIDLSVNTGNAKQIQFPAGDIGLQIVGDPVNTVGEDVYVLFIQDSVGGRSLVTVDSAIKNGGLMDALLDKAANAKTLFRLATLDGGVSYHATLVDLSTAAGGLLSTLSIDTDKDWAGRFITNIAGFDLFANSVANNITNMGALTFVSDVTVTRGQFGRSDFFLPTIVPDGLVTNIPNSQNITWTIDGTEKFQLEGSSGGKLIANVDLDMSTFNILNIDNARFVADSTIFPTDIDKSIILLNTGNQFQFNTSESNDFIFSFNNNTGVIFDHDVTNPSTPFRILTVQSDSTDTNSTTQLNLVKTFEPSTSLQNIGQIGFRAPDDTNSGTLEYAAIVAKIEDATAGSIDGSLGFEGTVDGSTTRFITINGTINHHIDILKDLDMNTFNILNIDNARFVADSTIFPTDIDKSIILLNTGNQFQFNTGVVNDILFSLENIPIFIVARDTTLNDQVDVTIQTDNTNDNSVAILSLSKAFDNPVTQGIGSLVFKAGTSTSVNSVVEYAAIVGEIEDKTDGSIDGSLRFDVTFANSSTSFMTMNDNSDGVIKALRDFNVNTFNLLNIDQAKFDSGSLLSAANAESVILFNTANQFQLNTSESNDFIFSFNNNPGVIFDHNTVTPSRILTVQSDSTDTNSISQININRTFEPSVSFQLIGQIGFRAPDDTNSGTLEYAAIVAKIEDATAGSIDGSLSFDVTVAQSVTPFLTMNFNNSGQIQARKPLDMSTNFTQYEERATPGGTLDTAKLYSKQDGDTLTKLFYVDSAGTEVGPLGTGGSSQTPWLSDIDAATFDLRNLSNLEFNNPSTGAPAGSVYNLHQTSTLLFYNVPTGGNHRFTENDSSILTMNTTNIAASVQLNMQTHNIVNIGILSFNNANTSITQSGASLLYDVAAGGNHTLRINDFAEFDFNSTALVMNGNTLNLAGGKLQFDTLNTTIKQFSLDLQLDVATGGGIALQVNNSTEYDFNADRADFQNNPITDLNNIQFNGAGGAPSSTIAYINAIGTGMVLNVPGGDTFSFDFVGTPNYVFSADQLDLKNNNLTMGTGNISAGGAGEGVTNIGHLDFVDNLATPVATFSIYSDGTDLLANTGSHVTNFDALIENPLTFNLDFANNDALNINTLTIVRDDGTARMSISGSSASSEVVIQDLVTNTDWRLAEALSDIIFYDSSVDTLFFEKNTTVRGSVFNVESDLITLGNAASDLISFIGKANTALNMDANKVVGVLNPTNPQDVVTLDYFNTNGIWLELDGSTTMTGDIEMGNQSINDVNDIGIVRDDGTARLVILGGTGATTQVLFDAVTGVDIRFTEGLADRFEIRNSDNSIHVFVPMLLENQNLGNIGVASGDEASFTTFLSDTTSTKAGYRDLGNSADPSVPTSGSFYFNTTTNKYRSFNGTTWDELGGGGGGEFFGPWTAPHDAGGFNLNTLDFIDFGTGSSPSGNIRLPNNGTVSWNSSPGGTAISWIVDVSETMVLTGASEFNLGNTTQKNTFFGASIVFQSSATVNSAFSYGDGVRQLFNPSVTVSGMNVGENAADPTTPFNGDIVYVAGSTNKFRFRQSGAWVELGGGGGGEFFGPWTAPHNAGNFNLTNLNQLAFNETNQTITDSATGLDFSVPDAADNFDFIINSTLMLRMEKFFADWSQTAQQFTTRTDPASPVSGDVFLYSKIGFGGVASVFQKQSDGTVTDLAAGGGGSSPLTTKGDLFGFSTVDARIPVGANGQVLTADSAESLGVKWAAAGLGTQTPWLTDIQADNKRLLDLFEIEMTGNAGATVFGKITTDTSGITISHPQPGDSIFLDGHNGTNVVNMMQLSAQTSIITLSNINTFDFNNTTLDDVGAIISNSSNPADSGFIRMGNGEVIAWESNPSGVDVSLQVNSLNNFVFSGHLTPSGTRSIGLVGDRWNSGFFDFLDVATSALFSGDVFLGNSPTDEINIAGNVVSDIKFNFGFTVDYNQSQSGVGAAGLADITPNRPDTYIVVKQGGVEFVVPAYAKS